MKKNFTYLVFAALTASPALAQDRPAAYVTQPNSIALYSVSPDGHYAAGEYYGRVQVYEMATGKIHEFYDETKVSVQGKDVSNNGIVVGQYGDELNVHPALWQAGAQEWTILQVPEDFNQKTGCAMGISSDGNIVVGYGAKTDGNYYPLMWTKNDKGSYETVALPYPEKDLFGMAPQMSIVQGLSDDGQTAYGRFVDYTGTVYLGILWQKDGDGNWTYRLLGEDYVIIGTEEDNPGPQPKFEDYVTAEPGTDEYTQQDNEFNFAMLDWWGEAEKYARLAYSQYDRIVTNINFITTDGKQLILNIPDGTSRIYDTTDKDLSYKTVNGSVTSMTNDGTLMFTNGVMPAGSSEKTGLEDWLNANYEVTIDPSFEGIYGSAPRISSEGNAIVNWYTLDNVITKAVAITLGNEWTTGIKNSTTDTGVKMSGTVLITGDGSADVKVFDASGRCILQKEVNGSIDLKDVCQGIAVINVRKANSESTLKVCLK